MFAVPPSGSGVERQFSIAGRVATWQRNKLSAETISRIMMYKNHMDGVLDIVSEPQFVESSGWGEIESDDEETETKDEEKISAKTLAQWRVGWTAGLKKGVKITV
jgi:hypothetical protein